VNRHRQLLLNGFAALALLFGIATAGLWYRSYHHHDIFRTKIPWCGMGLLIYDSADGRIDFTTKPSGWYIFHGELCFLFGIAGFSFWRTGRRRLPNDLAPGSDQKISN
jgi:hypothetical protein